ncbi:MAG: DUF5320 domain-containing protein [Anaerolineae bacterium]|jgi:hypothetical protein
MPRYDGTGPRGGGPMTGRGEGYCAIRLAQPGRPAYGYAGQQAKPVYLEALSPWLPEGARLARGRSPWTRHGRHINRRSRAV